MRNPWWSLSNFEATRAASALTGDAKQVHWQLSEAATAASTAQVTGFNYKEPKTEQEVRIAGTRVAGARVLLRGEGVSA
jgi:hypothetical protein